MAKKIVPLIARLQAENDDLKSHIKDLQAEVQHWQQASIDSSEMCESFAEWTSANGWVYNENCSCWYHSSDMARKRSTTTAELMADFRNRAK